MSYLPPVNQTSATPDWLDKGDQAWQLTAATLVGLQSVPGLGELAQVQPCELQKQH